MSGKGYIWADKETKCQSSALHKTDKQKMNANPRSCKGSHTRLPDYKNSLKTTSCTSTAQKLGVIDQCFLLYSRESLIMPMNFKAVFVGY